MVFEGIPNQIFQPYFYYSVIALVISFACIKIITRFCSFLGQRTRSLLYLLPLALPLVVMCIFVPSTAFQTSIQQVKTGVTSITTEAPNPSIISGIAPSLIQGATMVSVRVVTTLSVTGILCIIGLIAGAVFALLMTAADDRVARKFLHVISLSSDDYPWLQTKIAQLSKKLGIGTPKIGIVEDLRPNAFTIGYGRRATVVFSIGLLNVLSEEEMGAVASHELAHLKNHDFFYKILSSGLTAVSFFNPLAYITSSAGQREREMLADQQAIQLSEKPSVLGNAIAKICKSIQTLPKENTLVSLSSNLLVTSSVLHRFGILSTHPRLDKRLRNLSEPRSHGHMNRRNVCFAFFLCLMLACSAVFASNAMVQVQNSSASLQGPQDFRGQIKVGIVGDTGVEPPSPITVHVNGAQNMITSIVQMHPEINNETRIVVTNNGNFLNVQTFPENGLPWASP